MTKFDFFLIKFRFLGDGFPKSPPGAPPLFLHIFNIYIERFLTSPAWSLEQCTHCATSLSHFSYLESRWMKRDLFVDTKYYHFSGRCIDCCHLWLPFLLRPSLTHLPRLPCDDPAPPHQHLPDLQLLQHFLGQSSRLRHPDGLPTAWLWWLNCAEDSGFFLLSANEESFERWLSLWSNRRRSWRPCPTAWKLEHYPLVWKPFTN